MTVTHVRVCVRALCLLDLLSCLFAACLLAYLLVCWFVCCVCLFGCLLACLLVCLFACSFACVLVCLCVWFPFCLLVCWLVCMVACVFVCLFVFARVCICLRAPTHASRMHAFTCLLADKYRLHVKQLSRVALNVDKPFNSSKPLTSVDMCMCVYILGNYINFRTRIRKVTSR